MSDRELSAKIEEAVLALPKKGQQAIRNSFGPQFQVACLFECDWFKENSLTPRGRSEMEKLATELGVN